MSICHIYRSGMVKRPLSRHPTAVLSLHTSVNSGPDSTPRRSGRHCVSRPPAVDDTGARRGAETDAARSCRSAPFVSGHRSWRSGCICGALPPISAPRGSGRASQPTPHTRHRSPAHGRRAGRTIYTRCLMAFNAVFHTERCRSAFLAYLASWAESASRGSHVGVMSESDRAGSGPVGSQLPVQCFQTAAVSSRPGRGDAAWIVSPLEPASRS